MSLLYVREGKRYEKGGFRVLVFKKLVGIARVRFYHYFTPAIRIPLI